MTHRWMASPTGRAQRRESTGDSALKVALSVTPGIELGHGFHPLTTSHRFRCRVKPINLDGATARRSKRATYRNDVDMPRPVQQQDARPVAR